MALKIGLIGAKGRLGRAISALYPILPIFKGTPRTSICCDVLIDVSSHLALLENLRANLPIVIGTTGHRDFHLIEKTAQKIPIFYASNFSLGAFLLAKMTKHINQYFSGDIDLIETHHKQKKDAPSGTALHLVNNLPNAKIHSIRSGETIGEHTLIFNNADERLVLTHQVHRKEAFAKGALAAAHFLVNQPPGLYKMDNLFS